MQGHYTLNLHKMNYINQEYEILVGIGTKLTIEQTTFITIKYYKHFL